MGSETAPRRSVGTPLRVGDCLVDPQRNRISCEGEERRVEPKVMDLLLCLCARAGDVVSKDELLQTVWPGTFVTEHVLSHAVWQLRQALGQPGLIEAVPKRGYRLTVAVDAVASASRSTSRPAGARPPSLAVLPLSNLWGDPSQTSFADGMTEALILRLARFAGFRVVSRTSVMRYRDHPKPLKGVADELDVDHVVEGSVYRDGDRVRISVELIDARSDTHLWAESYERHLSNVLDLQRQVADAVAARVTATLRPISEGVFSRQVDPEAYDAYLRGRACWFKYSAANLDAALEYFRLASERDPSFAQPWSGIAQVWFSKENSGVAPPSEAVPRARAAVERALSLDDESAEAHAASGLVQFHFEWNWDLAEQAFRRSIGLDANSSDTRIFFSDFLFSMQRPVEGFEQIHHAVDRDPLNYGPRCFLGWYLLFCRQTEDALDQLLDVARLEPAFGAAHQGLWGAYYLQQRWGDALRAAKALFTIRGDAELLPGRLRHVDEGAYRKAMSRAADLLLKRVRTDYVPSLRVARLLAHGGDVERALHWLERAYMARESPLVHLAVAWDWDNLRADPRFVGLLDRIGLPRPASLAAGSP